jgi:ABC-type uncharacterized transport system ATPase subunit
VIHGVDLDIANGKFVVFVGPSGCGQSTHAAHDRGPGKHHGRLHIGGVLANGIAPAARRIAMVFQPYALDPHMTVYENMAFALKLAGHKPDAVRAEHVVLGAGGAGNRVRLGVGHVEYLGDQSIVYGSLPGAPAAARLPPPAPRWAPAAGPLPAVQRRGARPAAPAHG